MFPRYHLVILLEMPLRYSKTDGQGQLLRSLWLIPGSKKYFETYKSIFLIYHL